MTLIYVLLFRWLYDFILLLYVTFMFYYSDDIWAGAVSDFILLLMFYSDGMWARALYDFEATSDEELSFQEGQLIRVIQKDENGVDDGWWKGEINGKTGVFPSLVVEEISSAYTSEVSFL